ncbi:MAG: hypothetical protein HFH93_06455 [Lachnospiraceae bacterium]|nr:hypothetical protein [Lachnospiraceae bacterium]
MESTVKNLYDYLSSEVPLELRKWHVTEEETEEALALLGRDHASRNQVESAQEGDALLCRDAGDRMVPLYPGRRLPGAEEAEKSCVGRRVGDKFVCRLGDREVSLRVEEILRLEFHPVNDELIRLAGIPGVSTVAEYRIWYAGENGPKKRERAARMIAREFLEAVEEKTELSIDPEEQAAWCGVRGKMIYDAMVREGCDPHIPEEGTELLDDEEALARIVRQQKRFYRRFVISRHMARQGGCEYTREQFRKDVEKHLAVYGEEMKEMGYDLAEVSSEASFLMRMESAYDNYVAELLIKAAEQFLED